MSILACQIKAEIIKSRFWRVPIRTQVIFLNLIKRKCDIRIRLTPVGCDFQKVQIYIGGDRHILWPGSVMGLQFSELLYELYTLYSENDLRHYRKENSLPPNTGPDPAPYYRTTSKIVWDEEGRIDKITLTRRHMNCGRDLPDSLDQIEVDLDLPYGRYNYIVDGKDLCYAVAKACTEAIKKYGFMGYAHSSDLSFYLHAYEHRLNAKVYYFLRRNGMDTYNPALFLDLKLALQEVILKKLPTFDPAKGAKFLTYMYEFIGDALTSFRMREECWTIDSLDIYKGIRRMAAIYNANGGNAQNALEKFCEETGCKPKTAADYLDPVIGIRARQTEVVVDWDENDTEIIEDILPSRVGDLCYVLWNRRKIKAVRESLQKLSWRDQMILKARNAICNNCGGMRPMKEQYSFREISNLIGSSTDKGAEKAYHTALDRFTAQLAEDNVIRVVDMVRVEPERVKKKNAAATYRYQADCDGA